MLKTDICSTSLSIELRGIILVTMLDWVGKVACTLFVGGCNLRCPFCQNPELVICPEEQPIISWDKVKRHLEDKKEWFDGVVITGGEPTINHGLASFLSMLKKMDYPVKLDTNGTRPRVLSRLIREGLVDYIAMDVKSSFKKYPKATGTNIDIKKVEESIDVITTSNIPHEFRTTMVPGFVDEDYAIEIAHHLRSKEAKRYYLQQFRSEITLEPKIKEIKPYKVEKLIELKEVCNRLLPTELRG